MKITKVDTNKAPEAVGPYSQAIRVGDFIFCSGQIGIDSVTGSLVEGGIEKETEMVLKNLLEVLRVEKLTFKNVVKVDIFITNISDFTKVNKIYGKYFNTDPKPARATVEVSNLPKDAKIEMSCIACK